MRPNIFHSADRNVLVSTQELSRKISWQRLTSRPEAMAENLPAGRAFTKIKASRLECLAYSCNRLSVAQSEICIRQVGDLRSIQGRCLIRWGFGS